MTAVADRSLYIVEVSRCLPDMDSHRRVPCHRPGGKVDADAESLAITLGARWRCPRRSPGARPDIPRPPPARCQHRRNASGDDDDQWGHGSVVRADGRNPAGEEVVAERVSGELRLRPGVHRRVGLARHVRRRRRRSRRNVRRRDGWCARIDRDVRPLFVPTESRRGRRGQRVSVRAARAGRTTSSATCGSARSSTCSSEWRQQPAAFALRGMVKLPTARQRRRRRHRQGRFRCSTRSSSKELNQRVELSGFGGFIVRGDPDGVDLRERVPLGRRRRRCRRARACG